MWGQTTDYSGTYYIRSGSVKKSPSGNYYLCPTVGWAFFHATDNVNSTDNGQPFLTTHKMDSGDEARYKWKIEKHTEDDHDYYAFKYSIDYEVESSSYSRYLSYNRKLAGDGVGVDRMRIHLEKTEDPGDYELFDITPYNTYLVISPKKTDEDDSNTKKYLVVNGGNTNYFEAYFTSGGGVQSKDGGPDGFTLTTGIIGTFNTISDANAPFYLEDVIARPTIRYNSDNKVVITANQTGATIRYTLDGTTPSATNGETYETPLEPAHGTTIKAVAIIGSGESQSVSNIATFTYIKLADSYVIQSKDCEFYNLVPNLKIGEDDYPKNLTTLNVPCNTMVWNFETDNDGQYYYIHNSQGGYMYYTATSNSAKYVYFNDDKDTNNDGYKFSISAHASGGFNIIPKGQTLPINKSSIILNGNAKLTAVKLTGTLGEATSRWALIPYSEESAEAKRTSLPQWRGDAPFAESDDEHTYYYRINSVSKTNMPLILDNDGDIKSTTLPTSGYDNRKSVWVIKKVGTDTDGLLDYYTFQNAYTGEFLYLNKLEKEVKTDVSPGMLQMGQPDGADATWSHFVIVQTINNGYNIIPRVLVDNTKATGTGTTTHEGFNCINRANGSVYTGTWYDNDGGSRWTFEQKTDVKCMNPTFAEDAGGNFTISCVTNAAVIHYTTNGEEPTVSSGVYSAPIVSASEKICIKAIAIVGDGADDNSKSDIITLMNNPDITLKEGTAVVDDNTYIYDGTAKVPAVTISIGGVVAPSNTYTIDRTNNINAGIPDGTNPPTVNVADADDGDVWHIGNASKKFTINKKDLTATADNKTVSYGDAAPTYSISYTGFENGEDATTANITAPAVSCNYTTTSNVGSYPITISGGSAQNYNIIGHNSGMLTVNQKSIGDGNTPADGISIVLNTDGTLNSVKDGSATLTVDQDYISETTVEGVDKVVTVTGKGNYKDSAKGIYAQPDFKKPDGESSAAAVYTASMDLSNPTGIKPYIVRKVNPSIGTIVVSELDYIPEGVPVLLLSSAEVDGFVTSPKNPSTPEVADGTKNSNQLKVSQGGETVQAAQIYMFYQGEFVLTKAGTLGEGNYYLYNPNYSAQAQTAGGNSGSASSRGSLQIVFDDETTGILELNNSRIEELKSDVWYTLDGRRLSGKPMKSGIYILKGQKVIIKR